MSAPEQPTPIRTFSDYDVFISYSSKDEAVTDAVRSALEASNIRCWIAPRDIPPGKEWAGAIVEAIEACKVMVLVFSTHADQSVQVRREVQHACDNGRTVIPFRIEKVTPTGAMSYYLHGIHWLDALTPYMDRHREELASKVLANLPSRKPSGSQSRTLESGDDAPFQPLDTEAHLTIETAPPGATVYLDSQKQADTTPVTLSVDLVLEKSREVEVAVDLDGYGPQVFQTTLSRGKNRTLPLITLKPKPTPKPPPQRGRPSVESATPEPSSPVDGHTTASQTKVNPTDGAEMILIPSGEFLMGSNDYPDEKPSHKVTLEACFIYKTPVTVAQYRLFCAKTKRKMPKAPDFNKAWKNEDHPIVNVSWQDAADYCAWAGGDLPTEAQWEKAARGPNGWTYPWGNEWDASRCANSVGDQKLGGTVAVGSFPAGISPYGCLDMSGNVWEWCSDWYGGDYYNAAPNRNLQGPAEGQYRVLRGGSWGDNYPVNFRAAGRLTTNPRAWYGFVGFRVALQGSV